MNVSGVTGGGGNDQAASVKNSDLDREAFLKILVAQLKNQDPMSPLEDKDFIAQMAQFSVLEEVKNLGSEMTRMNVINYVGRYVSAMVNDMQVEGWVEGVSLKGNDAVLLIGDDVVKPSEVIGVFP